MSTLVNLDESGYRLFTQKHRLNRVRVKATRGEDFTCEWADGVGCNDSCILCDRAHKESDPKNDRRYMRRMIEGAKALALSRSDVLAGGGDAA